MSKDNIKLLNYLKNLNITLEGEPVLNSHLIEDYSIFLSKFLNRGKTNVALVMHLGSKLFDALLFSYFVIYLLVNHDLDVRGLINLLKPDQLVLYERKRFLYKGMKFVNNKEFIILHSEVKGSHDNRMLPENLWHKIEPYEGDATSQDGRGVRNNKHKQSRKNILADVFNYEENEITKIINSSVVLLMSKNDADYYIDNLRFNYNKISVKVNDLINVSYFTETNEIPYSNNLGKTEANLKITNSLSVLDQLVHQTIGYKTRGVGIIGDSQVQRSQNLIESYFYRESLNFVLVSDLITNFDTTRISNVSPKPEVYATTAEYLSSIMSRKHNNNGKLNRNLNNKIDILSNLSHNYFVASNILLESDFVKFKHSIKVIHSDENKSLNHERFIINAYTIMKAYTDTVTPMYFVEKMINDNKINVHSFRKRLDELYELRKDIPLRFKKDALRVIHILEKQLSFVNSYPPKTTEIISRLKGLIDYTKKPICIIVPKAHQAIALREYLSHIGLELNHNIEITSKNKYDRTKSYYEVIFTSPIIDENFNSTKVINSRKHLTLLYRYEYNRLEYCNYLFRNWFKTINDLITFESPLCRTEFEEASKTSILDEINLEKNINLYFKEPINFNSHKEIGGQAQVTTQTSFFILFDNNSQAFITEYYSAYLLNTESNIVVEKNAKDLKVGDRLLFNKRNEKRLDIIDEILESLILEDTDDKENMKYYKLSKIWRENLFKFMNENNFTKPVVSKKLIDAGLSVQESTVKRWLDEGANIVGPRNPKDLYAIGKAISDFHLEKHYKDYAIAIKNIRALRKNTMKQLSNLLGAAILKDDESYLPEKIKKNIHEMVEILTIEYISKEEHNVPNHFTNHPIIK